MKLLENSFNARLYKFIMAKKLPTNLCTYFWGLVYSYFISIFLFTVFLPGLISEQTSFFREKLSFKVRESKIRNIMLASVALYVITILILILVKMYIMGILGFFVTFKSKALYEEVIYGRIFWAITIGILVLSFIHKKYQIYNLKLKSIKLNWKSNIIIQYLKALISKYCPIIEWE